MKGDPLAKEQPSVMPEKEEEVLSFKARTHHGSGQKERYDLKVKCRVHHEKRLLISETVNLPRAWNYSSRGMEYSSNRIISC